MTTVSVAEAKARLSEILDRVLTGTEVLITRRGRPIAKIAALEQPKQPIDFAEIDALRESMPKTKTSSVELVRRARDGRY